MPVRYIVAHRGASAYEPENTMLAFEKAYKLGANVIEGDFRATRDGKIVCIHDETLDRTTNGKGRVEEMTFGEVRRLDAGKGAKVPTLEEFLDFILLKKIFGFIEIKTLGIEKASVETIQAKKAQSNAVIISFFPEVLNNVVRMTKDIPLGLIYALPSEDIIQKAREIPVGLLLPEKTLVSKELVDQAHGELITVVPWTVDTAAEAKQLERMGVDGIATNKPDEILAAVKFTPYAI